jgi:membrane protease YdiL (CAAX protease family)
LIYRVYLFEATGLWAKPKLAIAASALFFGWVHIVFAGWFAIATTAIGGLLLARTYINTRTKPGSLWIITLEHSLYGLAMFTVGLGRHFFIPR